MLSSGVIGYWIKKNDSRVDKIETIQEKTSENIANYKLESEKRYAKEETLQSSLARIHDRLDANNANAEKNFKELRDLIIKEMKRA